MDDIYQSVGGNRAAVLFDHIKALEQLDEVVVEARADFNERMGTAKKDGFDRNVVSYILKRRKAGHGQSVAFDVMLRDYEQAIESQAANGEPIHEPDPFAIDDAEQRA